MSKVPNTDTFNMHDVLGAIPLSLSNDFQSLITASNPLYFNPNYGAPPITSLLEFRDYGKAPVLNNIDQVYIYITRPSGYDSSNPLWIRTNYSNPYNWKDWLGEAMWKYRYFSLSNSTRILTYTDYWEGVGIQVINSNVLAMAQGLNLTYFEIDIRGLWRFYTSSETITLTAKNQQGDILDTTTLTVSAELDDGFNTYGYKYLGEKMCTVQIDNVQKTVQFVDVANSNYYAKSSTSTKSSPDSTSTVAKLKGILYNYEGGTILEKGFIYKFSEPSNLLIGQSGVTKIVVSDTSPGEFTYDLPRTSIIYYRTYSITSSGTFYGEDILESSPLLDGTGDLPNPIEITDIVNNGVNITISWTTLDSNVSFTLLVEENAGNWTINDGGVGTSVTYPYTANTNYKFRVLASNANGYVESEIISYST